MLKQETWNALAKHAKHVLVDADQAHDFAHVMRVVQNTRIIDATTDDPFGPAKVAALLHELVNLPKNHPESSRSGDLCAEAAAKLLADFDIFTSFRTEVVEAIRDHAFSKGVVPSSMVGKVLQDADRLDAIGAIGIARCIATSAVMNVPLYAEHDPFCKAREPNDKAFGIDHFYRKLLRIPETLHTAKARELAKKRIASMTAFLRDLEDEIGNG
jgi:uncharacterized protein